MEAHVAGSGAATTLLPENARLEVFTYDDRIVRMFVLATSIWGFIGMAVGALLALWDWQAIIVSAAITLPLGITTSKEYAELECRSTSQLRPCG